MRLWVISVGTVLFFVGTTTKPHMNRAYIGTYVGTVLFVSTTIKPPMNRVYIGHT